LSLSGVAALKAASDAEKNEKKKAQQQATMCVAGLEADKPRGSWD